MRWLVTVTAVWLCGLPSALAQSQDWLVLPTTAGGDSAWMEPTVDVLGRELRAQRVGVWRSSSASAAFERGRSAPVIQVSDAEFEAWTERSNQALRKLAMAQKEAALAEFQEAQAFSRAAIETLNRDPERAQAVLDTCLYFARARLANGDERFAELQAEECVRMVPSGEPSPRMHPPNVLALYQKASESPERTGTLRIESEPRGCPVRLNGVSVGETPVDLESLFPGPYRVQLECEPEASGRVHKVEVSSAGTSLFIFDDFDRAIRSEPVLHLAYDTPPGPARSAADARQLGRTLPAPVVVVVSRAGDDAVDVRAVGTALTETTLVRVPMTAIESRDEVVADAVTSLLANRCVDYSSDAPTSIDCATGEPLGAVAEDAVEPKTRPGVRPPRGHFIAGVTLTTSGAASLLAAYGLVIARRSAGDTWINAPGDLDAQRRWLNLGTGVLVTGSTGAGLLVAGLPLALPYQAKPPWWAWLSGGLGLVATAGAIASAVTAADKPRQSCTVSGPDPTPCVNRDRDTDRAFILGMTAAPLLTVPLVYLLRSDEKKLRTELAPTLVAGRRGGFVGVGGSF